jgi:recombination protein RecR
MKGSAQLERLVGCLCELPGIGRRSAERMALKLARDATLLKELIAALREASERVRSCSRCGSITRAEEDPCRLCTDAARDGRTLCVVEDPDDILPVERSGGFRGRYHSLMGKVSPREGTGPGDLRIAALLKRIDEEGITEVILALNTDVESDATASYMCELLKDRNVKVTRLAFGLPAGSGIMYSDSITLARAIKGRQPL